MDRNTRHAELFVIFYSQALTQCLNTLMTVLLFKSPAITGNSDRNMLTLLTVAGC